ncbi:PREDICTED: uncharacterized protein LOC103319467 [Prunus mume]|uniref:Uncharacterized protein LOC103319467 n=1 Tax=Prunus mume TaxID=102107 RepID=A0ABM1LIX6_PRUMU|nr:PREDICTED: uncharacterized protein LOC103319467 [Prunus mume]
MGWEAFLQVLAKLFLGVLSWPSFNLVYTLYASIQAIESDSHSRNQQCLSYWVMFALYKISEEALGKLFYWLPVWPYTKGAITILLVLPYFGGASYLYKHFIRPYISENSVIWKWNILSIQRINGFSSGEDNYPDVVDKNVIRTEPQKSEGAVIFKGTPASSSETEGREYTSPSSPKKIQREWTCALCLISTTSGKCLKKHLRGKKHKTQVEALRTYKQGPNSGYELSLKLKRTNGMIFNLNQMARANGKIFNLNQMARANGKIFNLNQIARANLEKWSGILSPVARPIRTCIWKKPELGWTKLNTDGSVDRENAGYGGLLRDYKGEPICAFVSKALGDDIFLVELWAIWRGLVLALSLGIKVIWVESDSESVVQTINRDRPYGQKASSCLKHIWELLKKFDKHQVSHSWRETNRAADLLSKMVLLGSDVVFWPVDFPDSLCNIIKEDAEGRIYFRC